MEFDFNFFLCMDKLVSIDSIYLVKLVYQFHMILNLISSYIL